MRELENLIIASISIYKNPEIIEDIIEFQEDLNRQIDENFKISLKKEGIKIACEKGCAYCCYGWEVKGNIAEIISIIKELNSLKVEDRKEISERLKNYLKFENLENIPCSFLNLEKNVCFVYNSRPFICRMYVSENINKCKNKEEITFPNSVEYVAKNVKLKSEEMISDEFKSLFNTKISITSISFDKKKNLFYIDIANTINLYVYPEEYKTKIQVEKGEYLKKFEKYFEI